MYGFSPHPDPRWYGYAYGASVKLYIALAPSETTPSAAPAALEKAHFDPSIAVRARKRHNRSRRGSPHPILGRPIGTLHGMTDLSRFHGRMRSVLKVRGWDMSAS